MPSTVTTSDLTFAVDTVAKFKPHAVVVGKRFFSTKRSEREKLAVELANLEKGAMGLYNGYMSPATRRQVKGLIENKLTAIQLCTKLKFPEKLPSETVFPTFVTLTLPVKQVHSDEDLRRYCFGPFIQYLTGDREKGLSGWGVRSYLWVAETQKNGNLHFHVLIDRAIPWRRIRDAWNRCLERLNYITDYGDWQRAVYRNGFRVRKEMLEHALEKARFRAKQQKKKFTARDRAAVVRRETDRQRRAYDEGVACDWTDPNSTDIHAIQNIKKLTAYVTKYMTKEPERAYRRASGELVGKLQPAQFIEETGGKTYLVTPNIETGTDFVTGRTATVDKTTREELHLVMLRRRMRGRIWGRADCLAQVEKVETRAGVVERPVVRPFETVTKSLEKWEDVDHITDTRTVTEWKETGTNLFGQPASRRVSRQEPYTYANPQAPRWVVTENETFQAYLEHLRGVVPEEDRRAATEKAGERFAQEGGEIIPLRRTQKDLLRQFSPDAFRPYFEHYARIFRKLWGEPPGGAPPGGAPPVEPGTTDGRTIPLNSAQARAA